MQVLTYLSFAEVNLLHGVPDVPELDINRWPLWKVVILLLEEPIVIHRVIVPLTVTQLYRIFPDRRTLTIRWTTTERGSRRWTTGRRSYRSRSGLGNGCTRTEARSHCARLG